MKPEDLLPGPQQSATGNGPEPIESNQHPQTQSTLKINFNIFFPSMSSLQSRVYPLGFQTKILFVFPVSSGVLRSPPILSSFSNHLILFVERVQTMRLITAQSYLSPCCALSLALLSTNITLCPLFSEHVKLCYSVQAKNQVSHPHK